MISKSIPEKKAVQAHRSGNGNSILNRKSSKQFQ